MITQLAIVAILSVSYVTLAYGDSDDLWCQTWAYPSDEVWYWAYTDYGVETMTALQYIGSGSMEPAIPTYAHYMINQLVPYNSVQVGDIVSFQYNGTEFGWYSMTHRMVERQGDIMVMKGDANPISYDFDYINRSQYIGVVDNASIRAPLFINFSGNGEYGVDRVIRVGDYNLTRAGLDNCHYTPMGYNDTRIAHLNITEPTAIIKAFTMPADDIPIEYAHLAEYFAQKVMWIYAYEDEYTPLNKLGMWLAFTLECNRIEFSWYDETIIKINCGGYRY